MLLTSTNLRARWCQLPGELPNTGSRPDTYVHVKAEHSCVLFLTKIHTVPRLRRTIQKVQNTISNHLSVTKENNRLDHSRHVFLWPGQTAVPHRVRLLQTMSDFARNERTVFSWDPRDYKVTHIAEDSNQYQHDGKTFPITVFSRQQQQTANCDCFQKKSSAQAKFVVPFISHKTPS